MGHLPTAHAQAPSRLLLASHGALLVLVAWLSSSTLRQRLRGAPVPLAGGGAAAGNGDAVPAWLRSDWEFPLPPELLDRGIIYEGDTAAARRLAQKLLAGRPVTVVTLGGSLTFGKGASSMGDTDWVSLVFGWLRTHFPVRGGGGGGGGGHTLVNAAVAAAPSEYISLCLQQHLPPGPGPDLVLVEYAVNDGLRPWHDAHRLSYERLLRRLLAQPSAPAVAGLMLHSYRPVQTNGTFHRSGEERLGTLMQYYGLPWLSMRSVVHHRLVAGEKGFRKEDWLKDETHPNDRGQTYVAQLVLRFLQRTLAREHAGLAAGGAAPPLPPPMLPGGEPLAAQACVQGEALQAAVVPGSMRGFDWELGGRREAPEVHASADGPGAKLTIRIDTDVEGGGGEPANATHVGVLLWYSWSRYMVGSGAASCEGGCTCTKQLLRTALRRPYGTQDHLWLFAATRSRDCLITIRTINATETVGHLFRFRGVLVSAEAATRPLPEFRLGENEEAELPLAE